MLESGAQTSFVMRLSLKIFGVQPPQLPANLRQQLTGWLDSAPAGAEGERRTVHLHPVPSTAKQLPSRQ